MHEDAIKTLGIEFFPTPTNIITRMLKPYRDENGRFASNMAVLDPSAGKGNILDYVKTATHGGARCYAIEIDGELAQLLRSKNYRVLGHDWLTTTPEQHFDIVAMNPPFSKGAKHLLHAWNHAKTESIVCLLNAETIRNPHTEERKLLANIIEDHGKVEFFGKCFDKSERDTDVEVACVWLTKKCDSGLNFEFDFSPETEKFVNQDLSTETVGTGIAHSDRIGATIRQYHEAINHFKNFVKAVDGMSFFASDFCGNHLEQTSSFNIAVASVTQNGSTESRINHFADSIRQQAWNSIIGKLGLEKYLTKALRDKFDAFLNETGSMSLTHENIANVVRNIIGNVDGIMDEAIVRVFDIFTAFHSENRCHTEGWKTNKSWRVNRKVILPYGVSWSYGSFSINYHRYEDYSDIDKVACYLSGSKIEEITTIERAIRDSFINPETKRSTYTTDWVESTFFRIKYFKKGTIHLFFKEEKLWNDFNIRAVAGKNWLGTGE